ncbi:MAG: carboxymuconolactone decarboxylase family protein, partial [Acidobacteriaceae bacterium]
KQNPAAPAVRDDAVYIPTSPNPVPALAHFCQVQVGHSSLAPKVAHRPEIFQTMIAHFEAVLHTGTLPLKLKELAIVRTSQLNQCSYCLASHSRICRNLGWSDDQLVNLADYAQRDDFTHAEKVALQLAEWMTRNQGPLTEEQWQQVRDVYSEGEVVELMAAIGLFNYFNRFNNLLDMEATAPAP